MCGLSGVVYDANLNKEHQELFRRLLALNAFRGWDSTGVVDYCHNAKKGNKVLYWRSLKDSCTWAGSDFFTNYDERWKKTPPSMLLGHSRAATIGKVTVDNAHPFKQDHILGMHNGTVKGEFPNWLDFKTDSEAIFHNIAKNGIDQTLKEIEKVDGAYVLVYLDLNEKTLNIIKNSKRPLWYWQEGSVGPIFWSSERETLDNCIKSVYGPAYKGFPKVFEDGVLYSIDYTAYSKKFEFSLRTVIAKPVYGGTTYTQIPFYRDGATTPIASTTPTNSNTAISQLHSSSINPWTRANIEKSGHSVCTDFYKHWDSKSSRWYSSFQQEKLLLWDKENIKLDDSIPFDSSTVGKEPAKKPEWFPIGPGKTISVSPSRYSGLLKSGCCSCGCVQFVPKGIPFDKEGVVDKGAIPIVWVTREDYLCIDCAIEESAKVYSDMDRSHTLPMDWRITLEEDLDVIAPPKVVEPTPESTQTLN